MCAVGHVAALAFAAMATGCGLSPAYEPEPRLPIAMATPATDGSRDVVADAPAPASSGEIAVGAETRDEYVDTDPSALTEFKPALEGHGEWVDDSTYGTVWVPAQAEVGTDFVPYATAGHWTFGDTTSYVWVSDYSWGWAPFHYGRWVHVGPRGWVWIPGRRYAGAWVDWRTGGPGYEYVGWGPARPDWYWHHGVATGWTFGFAPSYYYCHRDHFYDRDVGGRVIRHDDARATEHEGNTRVYTVANPTVGHRTLASPVVGPHPREFGIPSERVVMPPTDHRALAFATPRAVTAASAPPRRRVYDRFESTLAVPNRSYEVRPRDLPMLANVAPPSAASVRPAPFEHVAPSFHAAPSAPATVAPYRPAPVTVAPTYRPAPMVAAPTYRPAPMVAAPVYRPAPMVAAPVYRPAPATVAPTYRPAPMAAAPVYRPSPVVVAPVPRPVAPAPIFRAPVTVAPSFRAAQPQITAPFRSSAPRRGR
jgi:hypothetical protein